MRMAGRRRVALRQRVGPAVTLAALFCIGCGKPAPPAAPGPAALAAHSTAGVASASGERPTRAAQVAAPAVPASVAVIDPSEVPPSRSPELAALVAATGLQLPRSRCQQLIALPGNDSEAPSPVPAVVAAPTGLLLDGLRVGDLDCRLGDSACPATAPPPAARFQLPVDSLGRSGEVTVHTALLSALRRQGRGSAGGRAIVLFADARLSAQTLLILWQTLLAANRLPTLGAESDGWAVAHWPNEPPPESLPPPTPRAGSEPLPDDVEALVLELDGAPSAATALLTRRGGGVLQRPCRDHAPTGGCRQTLRDALAARPDLQEVTLDLGYGLDVATVAAWIEALRDPCQRDAAGACVGQAPAALAVNWIGRRGAQWSDSVGDPSREGAPVPAHTPPSDPGVRTAPSAAAAPQGGASGDKLPPESLLLGRGPPGGAPSLLRLRPQGSK